MAKTSRGIVRPAPEIKERAKSILKELGIPISSAHELFYRQIIAYRGLPFDARIPNQETLKAMHDARMGKGERYDSVESLYKDCGL